jgi:putative membrane protein (TIGR04086 family)
MIHAMKRGLDLHFGAVIVGVFVDQLGSFATGLAIAVCLPILGLTLDPGAPGGHGNLNVGQALYEAACILCGVAGGWTAARLARRSMIVHGLAASLASLAVSTALGVAMNQEMFDARGIFFAAIALAAGPLGGWLATLMPARRAQQAVAYEGRRLVEDARPAD